MTYTPTYDEDDISPITLDLVGTVLVEYIGQAPLFVKLAILAAVLGLVYVILRKVFSMFTGFGKK